MNPPILIIGAARSGTKLVRDCIAAHPDLRAIPYDINYVWRFGNEDVRHDELDPERATSAVVKRVRRYFRRYARDRHMIVEKTVSNALRIPFVDQVFPDARYVHLIRDGRDVIASSYLQWQAPADWSYVARKALRYPFLQAPRYAARQLVNLVSRAGVGGRPKTWGPRYHGIDADLRDKTILEVCAIQWERCVRAASRDLQSIPPSRVHLVHYADFVSDPIRHLQEFAVSFGIDEGPYAHLGKGVVRVDQSGRFRERLALDQVTTIEALVGQTLYQVANSRRSGDPR